MFTGALCHLIAPQAKTNRPAASAFGYCMNMDMPRFHSIVEKLNRYRLLNRRLKVKRA
jgi:hypothetical protein